MKKIHTDNSHSGFNRKKEHTSPTHFPKKQFQFIYRQKDQLPSSEAYESIIFMKSKKCENKSTHSTRKDASKNRKQPVQQLKKAMAEIEKQLKQQQSCKNKKEEEYRKAQILRSTSNNANKTKKEADYCKASSSHRFNKYQRVDISSSDNIKSYKNMLSPSRHNKDKVAYVRTNSTKFIKTQETFRKQAKPKEKKDKKQNRDPSKPIFNEQLQQYIFLEDNFVSINLQQISVLQEKMLSGRSFFMDNKETSKNRFKHSGLDQPIPEDQQTERVFQQYLLSSDKSSQPTPLEKSASSQNDIFIQNNILVVQKYIVSKVKLIQKWWRKMLVRYNKKSQQVSQVPANLDGEQKEDGDNEEQNQIDILPQDSIIFGSKVVCASQFGNSSPIKLANQFCTPQLQKNNAQTQIIISRQNAAKTQLDTHRTILESLLLNKRISPVTFAERKEIIQAKYYNELQQIQQLKKILRRNAEKAAETERKTLQDLKQMQNGETEISSTLLDKIFGTQYGSQIETQNKLDQIPILQNDMVYNRQKSTGCHFNSSQSAKSSIYKKQITKSQSYDQDFQEYDEEEDNNSNQQYKQFCSNNIKVGQSFNQNFKELFDQFKLRQEAKIQIDRRAAIQMGVLIQQIPEQIKDGIVGIDTSLNSIHHFLLAFFKYYIFYYKYDFLRLINMPYGFNVERRIKAHQGYSDDNCPEQDEDGVIYGLHAVIPEQIFEEFYQKVYDMGSGPMSTAKIANFQFQKVHNKALFDCFNQSLNYFRPYFLINGPPYPWNYSQKALTFYFIAQQNIQQVFQKTQFKVLKWASTLCGIIVNKFSNPPPPVCQDQGVQSLMDVYKQSNHPLLNETRQDRLSKSEKVDVVDTNNQWNNFQEQTTMNSLRITNMIFSSLVEEMALLLLKNRSVQKVSSYGHQIEKQMKTGLQFFQNMSENSSLSEFQIF